MRSSPQPSPLGAGSVPPTRDEREPGDRLGTGGVREETLHARVTPEAPKFLRVVTEEEVAARLGQGDADEELDPGAERVLPEDDDVVPGAEAGGAHLPDEVAGDHGLKARGGDRGGRRFGRGADRVRRRDDFEPGVEEDGALDAMTGGQPPEGLGLAPGRRRELGVELPADPEKSFREERLDRAAGLQALLHARLEDGEQRPTLRLGRGHHLALRLDQGERRGAQNQGEDEDDRRDGQRQAAHRAPGVRVRAGSAAMRRTAASIAAYPSASPSIRRRSVRRWPSSPIPIPTQVAGMPA
jgi:hypothetical protein